MGALQDLRQHLQAQEVDADPLQLGAVLLALARSQAWNQSPDVMIRWLEELALEVARNWHPREAPSAEQSMEDTVPIAELKKIAEELRRNRDKS